MRLLSKLLVAAATAVITSLSWSFATDRPSLWFLELLPSCAASPPELGFSVSYSVPPRNPETRCGTCAGGGPRSVDWDAGPHAGFEGLDPASIARDSLAWLEGAQEYEEWSGYGNLRLELDYRSAGHAVTARHDPASGGSWEETLRSFWRALPPDSESRDDGEPISWTIDFGDHGRVRGRAASMEVAVERMTVLARALPDEMPFGPRTFELAGMETIAPRVTNDYRVDTDRFDEIAELPARLVAQRDGAARKVGPNPVFHLDPGD